MASLAAKRCRPVEIFVGVGRQTQSLNLDNKLKLPQPACDSFSKKSRRTLKEVLDSLPAPLLSPLPTHPLTLVDCKPSTNSPNTPLCKTALSKKSMVINKRAKNSTVPETKRKEALMGHRYSNTNTVVCHSKRRPILNQVLGSCASVTKAEFTTKLSPAKAHRPAMLKLRFAETIARANRKIMSLHADDTSKQMQRITVQSQREKLRQIARESLLKMERSVEVEDHLQDLKELEMLCGNDEDMSLKVYLGLPLKKLGLCLKTDDLEDEDEDAFFNGDWEEGEIRS